MNFRTECKPISLACSAAAQLLYLHKLQDACQILQHLAHGQLTQILRGAEGTVHVFRNATEGVRLDGVVAKYRISYP